MTRTATARAGDTLDLICWRELGTTALVEAAFELNRGLADAGPLLAEGTVVILPDPPAASTTAARETVNLWD